MGGGNYKRGKMGRSEDKRGQSSISKLLTDTVVQSSPALTAISYLLINPILN